MAPPLAPEGDDRGDRDEECAGQRHRHDEQNVGDPHVVRRRRAALQCGARGGPRVVYEGFTKEDF